MKAIGREILFVLTLLRAAAATSSEDCKAPSLLQVQNRVLPAVSVLDEKEDAGDSIDVGLEASTCSVQYAGTETGAEISFQIGGQWTKPVQLVKMVPMGGLVNQAVRLSGWPTSIRLKALGDDEWCIDKLLITSGGYNVTILEHAEGDFQKRQGSVHWVGRNKDQDYEVPDLPDGVGATATSGSSYAFSANKSNCTTRFDERVQAMGYTTAKTGTPCVFGQDARDEGSHCIFDDGLYGSLGWCYTDKSKDTWGACGESCPLFGQDKLLGKKIDEVMNALKAHGQKLDEALATPSPTNASNFSVPEGFGDFPVEEALEEMVPPEAAAEETPEASAEELAADAEIPGASAEEVEAPIER